MTTATGAAVVWFTVKTAWFDPAATWTDAWLTGALPGWLLVSQTVTGAVVTLVSSTSPAANVPTALSEVWLSATDDSAGGAVGVHPERVAVTAVAPSVTATWQALDQ